MLVSVREDFDVPRKEMEAKMQYTQSTVIYKHKVHVSIHTTGIYIYTHHIDVWPSN